jgi:diacylglycerol kinase
MEANKPGTWSRKFGHAIVGVILAVRQENSFAVHLPVAAAVFAVAATRGKSTVEWAVLTLCVTFVLVAELLNTGLEHLARAVTKEHNENVRKALDVASGAVLVAAIGAAGAGLCVLA